MKICRSSSHTAVGVCSHRARASGRAAAAQGMQTVSAVHRSRRCCLSGCLLKDDLLPSCWPSVLSAWL